jgi:hypothetical protein
VAPPIKILLFVITIAFTLKYLLKFIAGTEVNWRRMFGWSALLTMTLGLRIPFMLISESDVYLRLVAVFIETASAALLWFLLESKLKVLDKMVMLKIVGIVALVRIVLRLVLPILW